MLFLAITSTTVLANEKKPYSLQFVELFASEVLIDNYKKQLKKRIFEKEPSYKEQESDVVKWLSAVFASGQYQDFLAKRYKLIFSEQEFKELVEFYRTETGKKFLITAPKMSTMSSTVAGQLIYKNLPELKKYLEKVKKVKKS